MLAAVTIAAAMPIPKRRRVGVGALHRHAAAHDPWAEADLSRPVYAAARFTADGLCPLRHTPVWQTLTDEQRRAYNRLVGLFQNEMIVFFETGLAATVLPAVLADGALPADLRGLLSAFLQDEQVHTAAFRALNRASRPAWYGEGRDFHILQVPPSFRRAADALARRPAMFPFVFWLMLMMEERSLMISRRVAEQADVCPRWAAVYQAHLIDEVRHVQADWHLLERFWHGRPRSLRRANALLLRATVVGLFLKPRRANVRLVELLIDDCPELRPRRDELADAARGLGDCIGYRRMMYSDEATPITRKLFHELPELRPLWRRIAG